MNSDHLLDAIGETKDQYILSAVESRTGRAVKGRSFKRPMLIAAVIVMMLALVGCAAAIYARITMRVVAKPQPQETVATQVEGQPVRTIEEILTTCYPQTLPEGYRCVSGSGDGAVARYLTFRNDKGTDIIFAISTSLDFSDGRLIPPVEKTEVTVSGQRAILTTSEAGAQNLIWENEEIGFYASLLTEDMGVDLLAMAESVAPGEPLELSFYNKDGELWDVWYPQKMPEGYECVQVSDVTSNGIQTIEYCNHEVEENGSIQYIISSEMDLSDIGEAPHSTMVWEDVDIAGTPGRKVSIGDHQWILFWKNEAEGFNARLMTFDPNVDLIEIAKTVGPGPKLAPTPSPAPSFTIELEQGDGYVGYEPWYPQWLPEGYTEDFVSDRAYGEQEIRYKNAAGDTIQYMFYFRLGKWGRTFGSAEEPEQVDINGHVGYKTTHSVIWTDEVRGYGFVIEASPEVDFLKMARSVANGEEPQATNAGKIEAALKELGDYQITVLPEGMEEDGLAGWPLEGEDAWYSYIRRWYFNKQTNAQIYFTYETYVTDSADSPKAVCKMILGGSERPLTEVTICGHEGYALEFEGTSSVAWAFGDGTKGVVFELSSQDFTTEELVQIAQSIEKQN